ncbi:MAG: hypothetical protein JNJ58_00195 [Chitinophagaceae bacterium]|nr:hypothetical protein [Chitinophagaceae bacterium]
MLSLYSLFLIKKRIHAYHKRIPEFILNAKRSFLSTTKMKGLFTLIFLFPFCVFGQSTKIPTKAVLTKTYSQAIADFIKAANKKNKVNFDTLFFGNRKVGDPENDFPDIALPKTIEKTQIRLISPEAGVISQNERKSRIYINMMGWVDQEKADFVFFVFSNGFEHQYDYFINYKYNSKRKEYELVKLKVTVPPFDK